MRKIKFILFIWFVSASFIEIQCQTVFSNDGKYGIIDDQSKRVVVSPIYDEITECFKQEGFGGKDNKKNHGFILRNDNGYYLALKQYWETKYFRNRDFSFSQDWGQIDSVSWTITQQNFDDLYHLALIEVNKKTSINQIELFKRDTCLNIYRVFHVLAYKKENNWGLITYEKVSRDFGDLRKGEVYTKKRIFSFENIQIHPPNFTSFSTLRSIDKRNTSIQGQDLIITLKQKKYGIIGLQKHIEITPQFDLIPKEQRIDFENFYYVKRDEFWGVIFPTVEDSNNYIVAIPFRYKNIVDVKNNFRNINFYSQHFYDKENSKRMEYDRKYTACVYNSSSDTLPVQLNFIIHTGELNERIIRNKNTNKEELNKNYKPPVEKYIKFNPLMNGKPIVQQEKHEYLITSNIENIVYSKNYLKTPLFFVLKMDRLDNVYNMDYNLHNRGEIKKDEIDTNYFKYNYEKEMNERFISVNQKPKAVAIYRFIDDSIVPLSEFVDSSGTTYEIISEFKEYVKSYYPVKKEVTYSSDLVLKSMKLENGKYKHTFFTFDGTQVYEITSKFPIEYWRFIQRDPNRTSSYTPDEDFALEFYTEIQGRRKTKEKIVCYYNVKTKQFDK